VSINVEISILGSYEKAVHVSVTTKARLIHSTEHQQRSDPECWSAPALLLSMETSTLILFNISMKISPRPNFHRYREMLSGAVESQLMIQYCFHHSVHSFISLRVTAIQIWVRCRVYSHQLLFFRNPILIDIIAFCGLHRTFKLSAIRFKF
jgi:hypothetical protein